MLFRGASTVAARPVRQAVAQVPKQANQDLTGDKPGKHRKLVESRKLKGQVRLPDGPCNPGRLQLRQHHEAAALKTALVRSLLPRSLLALAHLQKGTRPA